MSPTTAVTARALPRGRSMFAALGRGTLAATPGAFHGARAIAGAAR